MPHHRLVLTTAAALVLAHSTPVPAEITHRVALLAGVQAPGFEPGVTVVSTLPGLSEPAINQAGDIGCNVIVGGPGIVDAQTNGFAFLVIPASGRGPARLVARNGVQAPGLADGILIHTVGIPLLNESGRALFSGTLRGTGVTTANDNMLCLEQPGSSLALLLREGAQAPGLPAGINVGSYDATAGYAFNNAGQVVVTTLLTGGGVTTSNDSACFITSPANPLGLAVAFREGDSADFVAPGIQFGGLSQPLIAGNGDIVVLCTLAGASVTTNNDRAIILRRANGSFALLVREGDPIPAAPGSPGGNWGNTISPGLSPANTLVFYGTITGLPAAQAAAWVGPHDGSTPFRPAGVLGTAIIGLPAGVNVNAVSPTRYAASDDGRVAYFPSLAGTGVTTANDSAMLTEAVDGPGNPRLLAREGSPVVGITPAINQLPLNEQSNVIGINTRGQTAFIARATALGNGGDYAIWATNAAGTLSLVSFRDMPFTVAPGDVRTLSFTSNRPIVGPQSAWRTWFNNRGEIVYNVGFVGTAGTNSAIIVSTIDPPAPPCRADFNHDGDDTLQDLFDFLAAWFAQQPTADINGIDGITVQDLFDFLFYWFGGCP